MIAADDLALRALAQLEWPPSMRLKFLPSITQQNFPHLCSKIGLSQVLAAGANALSWGKLSWDGLEALFAMCIVPMSAHFRLTKFYLTRSQRMPF